MNCTKLRDKASKLKHFLVVNIIRSGIFRIIVPYFWQTFYGARCDFGNFTLGHGKSAKSFPANPRQIPSQVPCPNSNTNCNRISRKNTGSFCQNGSFATLSSKQQSIHKMLSTSPCLRHHVVCIS